MYLNYKKQNCSYARELRKQMTPHERKLWYCFLRGYPVRFLRQRPIDGYIVDFYCAGAKLAVELDGGQHYEDGGLAYDKHRDGALKRLGIMTLRFSNSDIDRRFPEVQAEIDRVVRERCGG